MPPLLKRFATTVYIKRNQEDAIERGLQCPVDSVPERSPQYSRQRADFNGTLSEIDEGQNHMIPAQPIGRGRIQIRSGLATNSPRVISSSRELMLYVQKH
jgi:hypothetical protein